MAAVRGAAIGVGAGAGGNVLGSLCRHARLRGHARTAARVSRADRRRRFRPADAAAGPGQVAPALAGERRCAGAAVSGPHLRRRDGRMGRAQPDGSGRRPERGGPGAGAGRPPGDPGDDAASEPPAPAGFPVLLPPRVALDRPHDLQTYDRVYLASRVHPGVSRSPGAGPAYGAATASPTCATSSFSAGSRRCTWGRGRGPR